MHSAARSPFQTREVRHYFPASNPPKTGHRRVRHSLLLGTLQDARSPRRTKCAARAPCVSEDVPKSKPMAGPDDSRAIYYPVFCRPAETPVTVERIRLMYSAFFSSAISSWFIRTSRRARTWAMDRRRRRGYGRERRSQARDGAAAAIRHRRWQDPLTGELHPVKTFSDRSWPIAQVQDTSWRCAGRS